MSFKLNFTEENSCIVSEMESVLSIANKFLGKEDSTVEAEFESAQLLYRLSVYEQSRVSMMKNMHMGK